MNLKTVITDHKSSWGIFQHSAHLPVLSPTSMSGYTSFSLFYHHLDQAQVLAKAGYFSGLLHLVVLSLAGTTLSFYIGGQKAFPSSEVIYALFPLSSYFIVSQTHCGTVSWSSSASSWWYCLKLLPWDWGGFLLILFMPSLCFLNCHGQECNVWSFRKWQHSFVQSSSTPKASSVFHREKITSEFLWVSHFPLSFHAPHCESVGSSQACNSITFIVKLNHDCP